MIQAAARVVHVAVNMHPLLLSASSVSGNHGIDLASLIPFNVGVSLGEKLILMLSGLYLTDDLGSI